MATVGWDSPFGNDPILDNPDEEKWESFADDLKYLCKSYEYRLSGLNVEFMKSPLDLKVNKIVTFKVATT